MEKLFSKLNDYLKLSSGLQSHLRTILRRRAFKKGEVIVREGDICKRIYYIERGLIRIYGSPGSKEATGWILRENHIFISVESFFNQIPSTEIIEALENTIVWSINFEELQQTKRLFPEFKDHESVIKNEYYALKDKRALLLLSMTPRERYAWFLKTESDLLGRVRAEVIYTYLGIERKTFFRIRSKIATGTKNTRK